MGFKLQKYYRVQLVLWIIYSLHLPMGNIKGIMVQTVFWSSCPTFKFYFNGHLMINLTIGNAGIIHALADHQKNSKYIIF